MMRSLRPSARAAFLAGVAVIVLAPDAAHAQLGGLKRRLGEKVGKAVLGEETAGRSAAPAFSDRVLQIDDARFDQLVRGLRVEAAESQKSERAQAAENAQMAEQEKKNEAYVGCVEPFAKELLRYTGMTMGLALAAKREQGKTGTAGGPMQDSLQVVTARMIKVKDAMVAKCGEEPKESSFDAVSEQEGTDPQALGARAAGLKAEQYAVLRERAAAFLQARGKGTGSYVFAADERALLQRRASELEAFRKLLD
jgi:hypothetical protein